MQVPSESEVVGTNSSGRSLPPASPHAWTHDGSIPKRKVYSPCGAARTAGRPRVVCVRTCIGLVHAWLPEAVCGQLGPHHLTGTSGHVHQMSHPGPAPAPPQLSDRPAPIPPRYRSGPDPAPVLPRSPPRSWLGPALAPTDCGTVLATFSARYAGCRAVPCNCDEHRKSGVRVVRRAGRQTSGMHPPTTLGKHGRTILFGGGGAQTKMSWRSLLTLQYSR